MMTPRLHPDTLARLPHDVLRPRYARERLRGGIVHLGIGAFHRAHQAAATEAALHADAADAHSLDWGIVGVSLRRPDTRDALAPQQGLYTLALRGVRDDGSRFAQLQVIGAVIAVLVAADDPDAVLERIAHADARIVSLTVTEKGYCHDPATGTLNFSDPGIAHDLLHAGAPVTAIGYLARGLQRRMARGLPPLTLLSCDNIAANGDTLRGLLLAFCARVDGALHDWVAERCGFPNAMVDRIVPKTTVDDAARISAALGVEDAWPVVGEPFLQWVMEDRFVAGRPRWEAGGAQFVEHAHPFEALKHRLVNGSHSTMAYLGMVAGWATTDRAIAVPAVRALVAGMMEQEMLPTLPALPGLDTAAYRRDLLARFANPALQHKTSQIAMDGSQKIPQRLLAPIRERLRIGAPFPRLALGVAGWLHFLRGRDEHGAEYRIEDPLASSLHALLAEADARHAGEADRIAAIASFTPVFGDLAASRVFVETLATHTRMLRERGVLATLAAVAGTQAGAA
ncbi:mannitol dehydrogenase family protein [Cupriavidus basilensis]|uniref:mannitol dehydrogenase family protein n=1 Tax=Cupriavidus basilensis TaxID=68895 RepID=UPI0020A66E07|nr:mannitol dehydrogenase family protein [Cupriavidus basilensis]MCP3018996.1 mannitol dehydrogenase family protein [Cupriavidus basilensis]